MRSKVAREEALGRAKGEVLGDGVDGRLDALEREQKIDSLLEEIKAKRQPSRFDQRHLSLSAHKGFSPR